MAYKHRDHAWITTWGIKDGKEYVVVVMVEHGGGGGSVAGPVAQKVYTALFGPDQGAPVQPFFDEIWHLFRGEKSLGDFLIPLENNDTEQQG